MSLTQMGLPERTRSRRSLKGKTSGEQMNIRMRLSFATVVKGLYTLSSGGLGLHEEGVIKQLKPVKKVVESIGFR